jgi:thiamine-phosphate pyrophosphorylase
MDRKLVDWARAVKARNAGTGRKLPPLWLFTDRSRLPDPAPVIARLPKGLAGVVLRDGGDGAVARARRIAAICRRRRLVLVIAGSQRQLTRRGTGAHLSAGRRTAAALPALRTSSAHNATEIRRAAKAGAAVIFLSPVFATASHPGAPSLGVPRWAALSRHDRSRVGALGGVDGRFVKQLPRWCRYAGAIGAFA